MSFNTIPGAVLYDTLLAHEQTIAELRKENERLKEVAGKSTADLMGCRDGALVRDQERIIDELRSIRDRLVEWDRGLMDWQRNPPSALGQIIADARASKEQQT